GESLTRQIQLSFKSLEEFLISLPLLDIFHSDQGRPQVVKTILFYKAIKLLPSFHIKIRNIIKGHKHPVLIFIQPVEEGGIDLISVIVHKYDVYPISFDYIFPHLFFFLCHMIKPKKVLIVYSRGPPVYVDGDIRPEVPDEISAEVIVVEYIPSD